MCRLRNTKLCMTTKKVTIEQTDTHGQTDAGQSDPYVQLCFTDGTKTERQESEYIYRILGNFRVGLIFPEFATSLESPKTHTAKNRHYFNILH